MADEITFTHGTAFSVPDNRITRNTAAESFTEAGPLTGIPDPQQLTDMHATASGQQDAGSQVRVRTQRAGYAGAERGAAGVWRREGDPLWRGMDPPPKFGTFRPVQWQDGAGDYKYSRNPHAVTLPDQSEVVAYDYRNDAVSAEAFGVRTRTFNAQGLLTSEVQVYAQTSQPVATGNLTDFFPCLLVLPNGRVMLYHFVYEAGPLAQVRAFYSDDSGLTWAAGEQYCLDADIDINASTGLKPLRLTAAYNNNQVCLFIWNQSATNLADSNDILAQYRSTDLGNSFKLIVQQDGTEAGAGGGTGGGGFPSVIATGQGFGLAFVDGGATGPVGATGAVGLYVPLGSADQPFTEVLAAGNAVTIASTGTEWADHSTSPQEFTLTAPNAIGECSISVDDVGNIWALSNHVRLTAGSGIYEGVAYVSRDGGKSFESTSIGGSTTGEFGRWWSAETAVHPSRIQANWSRGEMHVYSHNTGGTYAGSVSVIILGGSSTVVMPAIERFQDLVIKEKAF